MKWLLAFVLVAICSSLANEPKVLPYNPPAKVDKRAERCLAWVLYDEARGESLKGARAVLDAVKTRMKKRKMGACAVVAQKGQFSGYHPGIALKTVTDSVLARYYMVSRLQPVVAGCDYFHATYVQPQWADKMIRCASIGKHIFYKEK